MEVLVFKIKRYYKIIVKKSLIFNKNPFQGIDRPALCRELTLDEGLAKTADLHSIVHFETKNITGPTKILRT